MQSYSLITSKRNQPGLTPGSTHTKSPFFQPVIQAKLTINQPGDVFEQEADAMADKVMGMPLNESDAAPGLWRKCAECEEEEKKLQRKQSSNEEAEASNELENYISKLDHGGKPLSQEIRNFYEPRFGYDFSNVRVHSDEIAAKSAHSLNALAYTSGNNIVFNAGQYSPGTETGKKLLGHELTHVVQQRNGVHAKKIQRMTMGSSTPPNWSAPANIRPVPANEVARVQAAIDMISHIVNNPGSYKDCISVFIEHCTSHNATAFADTFNNAVIWRGDEEGAYARGDSPGTNIVYTQSGYDQGTRGLAQTLVHEMGHNCGVSGAADHYLAEVSANYCIGPVNEIQLRFRSGLNSPMYGLAFTYRRFFDLALGGQLQATVGGDIDVLGAGLGITHAADPSAGRYIGAFELGSLTAGLSTRFNPWGGEGFGGLRLGAEAGLDVGRFRVVREARPDEFEYGPGFIFQSTLGAEFYIPMNPHIAQFSLDVGYRAIRPLNSQAETVHEFILGVGGMF
jgi:hypothetical protein